MVFVVSTGYYMLSQERLLPPVKKPYKLEVVKKKKPLPIKKKKIRKMVKKKQIRVFPILPKVLSRIQPQAQVIRIAEVARVTPIVAPLKSMPLKSTPTVSRQALVQTASVSSLKRSYPAVSAPRTLQSTVMPSMASGRVAPIQRQVKRVRAVAITPRSFQATRKMQAAHTGGHLIQKGVRKTSVPVFQVRAIQSGISLGEGKGVVKTALFSESIAQFRTVAFQPRPVPNVSNPDALRGYTRGVQRKIAARKEYPPRAKRNGMEGQITVQFTVLKSGDVKNLKLVSKTPYDILNEAALKAVKQAAPFPGLPEGIGWDFLELELPFKFELKK